MEKITNWSEWPKGQWLWCLIPAGAVSSRTRSRFCRHGATPVQGPWDCSVWPLAFRCVGRGSRFCHAQLGSVDIIDVTVMVELRWVGLAPSFGGLLDFGSLLWIGLLVPSLGALREPIHGLAGVVLLSTGLPQAPCSPGPAWAAARGRQAHRLTSRWLHGGSWPWWLRLAVVGG